MKEEMKERRGNNVAFYTWLAIVAASSSIAMPRCGCRPCGTSTAKKRDVSGELEHLTWSQGLEVF